MPNITDYFSKCADDSGKYPVVATVTKARAGGGDTLELDSLEGWNTTTPVHFMSYSKNEDGQIDLASQADYKGLVVENTITQLKLTRGVDNGHKIGDQIVLNPTAGWLDDLMSGLGVSLNPDGTLKDGIVKTSYSYEKQYLGKGPDGHNMYVIWFEKDYNNENGEVLVGTLTDNINLVLDISGVFQHKGRETFRPLPRASLTLRDNINLGINDKKVYIDIDTTSGWSNYDKIIVKVEYTVK